MWDQRGGSITRVADTLIISVSQPGEAALWDTNPATAAGADRATETAECRTQVCPLPTGAGAALGDCSPPVSGTWLGGDSDTVQGLGCPQEPAAAAAASEGDGIQIICRFDSPPRPPSPPSSPPPYPPPPPPTESPPTLAALSQNVSEFSSIIEIDGDSFCIRSRLAGREEPETSSELPDSPSSTARRESERDDSDDDSDMSDSDSEVAALVAECRRFYEARLVPRWPALQPAEPSDTDRSASNPEAEEDEEDEVERRMTGELEEEQERPTSVDSGRESGADSRTTDSEEGDAKRTEPPTLTRTQSQSPLEAKMALLRREMGALMRQDNELFQQLFSLHESIEALKHGEGSLSAGSSLSSLADIEEEEEEEDTISNPSTDLDRQSHLSSDTDNFSLVKGDTASERSFFSEILHVTGMSHWAKTRLTGPDSLTLSEKMSPPSPRQAAPASQSPPAEKAAPRGRHRKQGSCDSGIVDQEIRGQA